MTGSGNLAIDRLMQLQVDFTFHCIRLGTAIFELF
jgi:hypothetical protein